MEFDTYSGPIELPQKKWTELNTENPSGKVNAIKFILK